MSWHKIWLVGKREYLYNFRRTSFLFTAFGVPLISIAAMFLITQFTVQQETNLDDFQQVAYIDRAGIIDPDVPTSEDYVAFSDPSLTAPDDSASEDARAAYYDELQTTATQQVLDGDLDAYFVVGAEYVYTGQVSLYADQDTPGQLTDNIEDFMQAQIVSRTPDALPVPVERLDDTNFTLRDLETDEELNEAALIGRLMLPFVFAILYFMATSTTAQFLMSGIVEEKENRLMEILATSLRPIELLWGKLFGLGALALSQIMIWISAGLILATLNDSARDFLTSVTFAPLDLALLIGLFLINFMLFSSILLSIGASVTAEAESRQIAGMITFASVLPLAGLTFFFQNPDGTIPVVLSFFPLTAAVSIVLRLGMGALPTWQLWASIAIQIVSVLVVMWIGAKAFRLGMLMYGKRLTPRALFEALRQGQTTLTSSANTETQQDTGGVK